MSRIIPTVLPLTGEPHTTQGRWQKADQTGRIVWKFQRPTRVEGFEVRDSWNGWITQLTVGIEANLAAALPVDALPQEGLLLRTIVPGIDLTIDTQGFTGEIRPIGVQIV